MPHPKYYHAPARVLLAVLFIVSGTGKLTNVEATQKYMEAFGVPGNLLWPAAAFEIASGAALLTGWNTRAFGMPLALWCLLTAAIFHRDFGDQEQQINFMKNMVMAGGFLILVEHGAPHMSLGIRFLHVEEAKEPEADLPEYSTVQKEPSIYKHE